MKFRSFSSSNSNSTYSADCSSTRSAARHSLAAILFLLIWSWGSISCDKGLSTTPGTTPVPGPPTVAPGDPGNKLAEGDVIRISFPGAPEYNQEQKIRADGKISLAMIGEVTAIGKSPKSLQEELTRKFKSKLTTPETLVSLISSAAGVYVSGAVGSPRKIPLDRPLTAFEAVMEAGGFAPSADQKKVTLVRKNGEKYESYQIDLSGPLGTTSSEALYLQAYDTIHVGQRFW